MALINPTLHVTIKSGIAAHAEWFYVARQLDGATPQSFQKMTLDALSSDPSQAPGHSFSA